LPILLWGKRRCKPIAVVSLCCGGFINLKSGTGCLLSKKEKLLLVWFMRAFCCLGTYVSASVGFSIAPCVADLSQVCVALLSSLKGSRQSKVEQEHTHWFENKGLRCFVLRKNLQRFLFTPYLFMLTAYN
jgi:hypothetical protein